MKNKNTSFILQMAAMFVAVIMTVLSVFGIGYSLGLFNYDDGSAAENFDNLVIGEGKSNGISLTSSLYEVYDTDITNTETEAYTITATINPSDATYQTVTMSVAWADSTSSWATDKEVTDYVTIKQKSTGSLTGTLTCLQAFGEQVILTVAWSEDSSVYAEATVDYVARVTGIKDPIMFGSSYTEYYLPGIGMLDFGDCLNFSCALTLSDDYTIAGTVEGTVYLDFYGQECVDDTLADNVYGYRYLSQYVFYDEDLGSGMIDTSSSQPGLYSLGTFSTRSIKLTTSALFENGFYDLLKSMFTFDSALKNSVYADKVNSIENYYIGFYAGVDYRNFLYGSSEVPLVGVIVEYTYTYNEKVYSSGQLMAGYVAFSASSLEVSATSVGLNETAFVF